jgi:hypothetical protein
MAKIHKVSLDNTDYDLESDSISDTLYVRCRYNGAAAISDVTVKFAKDGVMIQEERSNGSILSRVRRMGDSVIFDSRGYLESEDGQRFPLNETITYKNVEDFGKAQSRIVSAIRNAIKALNLKTDNLTLSTTQQQIIRSASTAYDKQEVAI